MNRTTYTGDFTKQTDIDMANIRKILTKGGYLNTLAAMDKWHTKWLDDISPQPKALTSKYVKAIECHVGTPLAFTIHNVEFYGGGTSRGGKWSTMKPPPEIVICPTEYAGVSYPSGWRISLYSPQFISMVWPDYQAPSMAREFWFDLWEDIIDKNIGRVLCQCMGGHGRTGTMLSIMYGIAALRGDAIVLNGENIKALDANPLATTDDVVELVRLKYCDHAVESTEQMRYIAYVLGLPYADRARPFKESTYHNTQAYSTPYVFGAETP